jgi:hypothetical protein
MNFGYDLLTNCQTSTQPQSKNWLGLTPMGQQEPASKCNIANQTHMEDIHLSEGN